MMRAVLSTGSNMEDSRAHLAAVEEDFAAQVVAASPVYATAPWGGVEQPDFLNQVLIVEVDCSPAALLARCQALEQRANRVRKVRWGPRTLDVDIITLTDANGHEITLSDPELTVPHPRAHQRAFVLVPWLAVDPDAALGGERVDRLVGRLGPDQVAEVREDTEETEDTEDTA